MVHVDLYAGIGGFTLACEWNGIETILFVEKDAYCQKVLRKHYPGVPIVREIRHVEEIKEVVANATGKRLPNRGRTSLANPGEEKPESNRCDSSRNRIQSNTIRRRGSRGTPAILVTAGFPCQPFSVAGKRQGEADDRYLWNETLKVIKAIEPAWVLLENVTGIINLALDTVLSDLEDSGYSWETLIIPACAVNAPHRRDRVWIVGYSKKLHQYASHDKRTKSKAQVPQFGNASGTESLPISQSRESRQQTEQERGEGSSGGSQEVIADTAECGLEAHRNEESSGGLHSEGRPDTFRGGNPSPEWWAVEPELGRVAYGIPHRVDRLKCLGNAIVPQVAYEIIRTIKEVEYGSR